MLKNLFARIADFVKIFLKSYYLANMESHQAQRVLYPKTASFITYCRKIQG
jgi:hypothetical protein